MQFLIVTLATEVVPLEPINNTLGDDVLVLDIVKFLDDDPLLEPSIVT